jgi:hypothetical protein
MKHEQEKDEISLDERRSRLERRANVIRSRLLRRIDALDTRRHQVTQIGNEAKRLAAPVLASFLGLAAVAAGMTFAVRAVMRRRRERFFSYRLARALEPLRHEERPSLLADALRKAAITGVGIVVTELARRGMKSLLDGRTPLGRQLRAAPDDPTNGASAPRPQLVAASLIR